MATLMTDEQKSIYPDNVFHARDIAPEALILKMTTSGGSVEGDAPVVRVPYVSDLPEVHVVDEGEGVTGSEPAYDEKLIGTQKLMLISRMTREASTHSVASSLLASSMGSAVTRKANQVFLNGMANSSDSRTTAGIVDLAGTTATAALTSLDPLIDLITELETEGATPSDMVTDPATWATIMKLKAGDGSNLPLVGAPAQTTQRTLFGCTVHVTPDVPANTLLVADRRALISVTGTVQVAVSDDVFFNSDTIARRLIWRIGWDAVHPERLGKLTITA